MTVAEALLDDVARLEAGDPGRMLPDVASAAAQVREAAVLAAEAGVARLAEEAARTLEEVADRCRVDAASLVNPAKRLALDLQGRLPVLWGTSPLAGAVAYRFACQLNENAKTPATWGTLPEANHNQVVAFDGPVAGGAPSGNADDLFRDRGDDDDDVESRLALVLLRDSDEHPQVARRAEVSAELARERDIPVLPLRAEGSSSFARLASLVGTTDWASAYLALALGIDPTPVDAITALKQRIRG